MRLLLIIAVLLFFVTAPAFAGKGKTSSESYDATLGQYTTEFSATVEKQTELEFEKNQFVIVVNDRFYEDIKIGLPTINVVNFSFLEDLIEREGIPLSASVKTIWGLQELAGMLDERLLLFNFSFEDRSNITIKLTDIMTDKSYFIARVPGKAFASRPSKKRNRKIFALYNSLFGYLRGVNPGPAQ